MNVGALISVFSLGLVCLVSGQSFAGPSTLAFDGQRAMALLEELTAIGQRYPGAKDRDSAIQRLSRYLSDAGAAVTLEPFESISPIDGKTYPFHNIVARFQPSRPQRILLGTHFDTRSVGDLDASPKRRKEPIPGANDGTSGVAVLLELARHLPKLLEEKRWGVDIVLFDAEDLGTRSELSGFSRGAKFFAKRLSQKQVDAYLGAVIVDMVGERDLVLKRESYSLQRAETLTNLIWRYGQARSKETFTMVKGGGVIDDHLPLLERGIPATLLIDLDYPQWHTASDKPEYCSARSLDIVGDTLEAYLRDLNI